MTRTKNTFAFTATSTTATQTVNENGFVKMLIVDCDNLTNAVTLTVDIKDGDGYVVYTKASIAENAITRVDELTTPALGEVPIDYKYTITVTLSGAAGGSGGNVDVMLYILTDRGY